MSATIDASDFLAHMKRAELGVTNAARVAPRAAALEGWKSARNTTKFQNRTGKLWGSITFDTDETAFRSSVRAGAKHASFVESGTPRHMIAGNLTLRFAWKGVVVFRRYVMHPGTKPTYFMATAGSDGEHALLATLQRETDAAVTG